ncbi:MAG: CinA family protein [Planctomycetes bacterium]|nr:CinA family protein [Planctomycetota bacterium]
MSAQVIGTLLLEKNFTLTTAESCTAGLLSTLIVEVSGASDWFLGGWVTYSNAMKVSQLGVTQFALEEHGAVSAEVAAAMVRGASKASGSHVALSITGIAGPTGGSVEKPIGTVFIGCKVQEDVQVREFRFSGTRSEIQTLAAQTALEMLRLQLTAEQTDAMCCQLGEVIRAD